MATASATTADAVVEMLAASEAELLEQHASLLADVQVYREMALVGLEMVTRLTAQLTAARGELARLRGARQRGGSSGDSRRVVASSPIPAGRDARYGFNTSRQTVSVSSSGSTDATTAP
jgi:uncharacterized membrane-anchored protein